MELGEKLLRARQEAGLSQRQLCGEEITRNMLSQIEHGTARPSMSTLQYLASRLGKPVSYFLEEDAVTSPNQSVMADARKAYDAGEFALALEILEDYQTPDETFERERQLLEVLLLLEIAEQAIRDRKMPYANEILEKTRQAETAMTYRIPELERRRLLLLARIPETDLAALTVSLPSLDEELLLRAEAALAQENPGRASSLLAAAENREDPWWNLLRGKAYFQQHRYALAAECLQKAEEDYPNDSWPLLEICCRELGDFQHAYVYACKQR